MSLVFKVPSTIYKEISEYDVAKPVQTVQAVKKPDPPVKPKNFGKPYDLLPINILSTEGQTTMVNTTHNAMERIRRSWNRSIVKDVNSNAIIGFNGVLWYSMWLIPDHPENVYGLKIFMRNIVSYKKHSAFLDTLKTFNIDSSEIFTEEFENATKKPKTIEFSKIVTVEDIKKGKYISFYGNLQGNGPFATALCDHLSRKLPVWKDKNPHSYWSRVNIQNILRRVQNTPYKEFCDYQHLYGFQRLRSNSNEKFKELNLKSFYAHLSQKQQEKLDTPYVKKLIKESIDFINNYYDNPKNENYQVFLNSINSLMSRIAFVSSICEIYDNLSVDQINNLFSVSFVDNKRVPSRPDFALNEKSKQWMNENVPFKSAFNMLKTDHNLFRDSMSMLNSVIIRRNDLKYEDRFRISTFHDFIMAEQWKLNNKDAPLPQYLIPNPIKVKQEWTFLQPNSIHQLARWGREARNCVGGYYYINGIRDKRHFIVLAMKNHVPTFTIQLVLRNGNLEVSQIRKSSNAALNNSEMKEYEQLFSELMKIREEQIKQEELNKVENQIAIGEG